MKKIFWLILLALLACTLALASCGGGADPANDNNPNGGESCQHSFGEWITTKQATCKKEGELRRTCSKCAQAETQSIPKTDDHSPVTDAAVAATCQATGRTEGSHCSVCNKVLTAQTELDKIDHAEDEISCFYGAPCSLCGHVNASVTKHVIQNGTCTLCGAIAIRTAEELRAMELDGKYVLTANISLEGTWTPIGTTTLPFSGSFDGNGYTVSGLMVTDPYICYGLFGYNIGTIQNVAIEGVIIQSTVPLSGAIYVGTLVGYNSGTVQNCYADGVSVSVTAAPNIGIATGYAGGLIGYNAGAILNCYAAGDAVSMTATSSTSSTYTYVGGLVGTNKNGTVSNCFSAVEAISGAYSCSNSQGISLVGGLVGQNSSGKITNCYRDSAQTFSCTTNEDTSSESTNDMGTATTDLKTAAFATDALGWSSDSWTISNGELPTLTENARIAVE